VQVKVSAQLLVPGVQHREKPQGCFELVAAEGEQRLRGGVEQEIHPEA
jgi:hypothetical protein